MGQHGIAISQGQPYLFGMVVKTQEPVEFTVSFNRPGREGCLSPRHVRRRWGGMDPFRGGAYPSGR